MTVREFIGALLEESYADFLVFKLKTQENFSEIKFVLKESKDVFGTNRYCIEVIVTDEPYTCGDFYKDFSIMEKYDCILFNNETIDECEVYEDFNFGSLELEFVWL